MIQAEFKKNQQGNFVSFEMKGHAESGPYGYDIVCAACSALSINAVNSIYELAEYSPICEMESGYLYFEQLDGLEEQQISITNLLIHSLWIGLKAIEEDNQEFVQVNLK